MYIMLNRNIKCHWATCVVVGTVASQECWHPANILDPDLALAINSLARLVDRIIGPHRLLTLIVSLPLSNPNAELTGK